MLHYGFTLVWSTSRSLNMKSPSILLSIVAAVTMTFGLSTSSVQAHDGSADLNHDGWVNSYDISILLSEWGHVADGVLHSDINGDFEVGAADFAILIGALGPVPLTVSCTAVLPSLGDKLSNVITSTDQTLHVTQVTPGDWTPDLSDNTYILCYDSSEPIAVIQGRLRSSYPSQFDTLALVSGEDDIVLKPGPGTHFTPANKGQTLNFNTEKTTQDFLSSGIPINFTPSTPTGYVNVNGAPLNMIFYYNKVEPSTSSCTASPCCLLTGCKLVGISNSFPANYPGRFPDQNFGNGSVAVECTAPTKGKTVSNSSQTVIPIPASPSTFNLTVLSTAGFDPAGTFIVTSNDVPPTKILVSYTSITLTTFNGCKAVVPTETGAPTSFTIKAGMSISMENLSDHYLIKFSDLSGLINARLGTSNTTYGIYVMGFAKPDPTPIGKSAWLDVDPSNPSNPMKFIVRDNTDTPAFYPVNKITDSTTLKLDSTLPLAGGRIYFFALRTDFANNNPFFKFGTQPILTNPDSLLPSPPFAFFEFTVPANNTTTAPGYTIPNNATFDVQQVDAFQFPMTMAWQTSASDLIPISNSENNVIVGQKICDPISTTTDNFSASRESILKAFDDFFPLLIPISPYRDLKLPPLAFTFPPAIIPQPAGILAPSHYLETIYNNGHSGLNTVFDSDLKTLFSPVATGLRIWGNESGDSSISKQYYDVVYEPIAYPTDTPPHVTPAPLIPALKLTGSVPSEEGGITPAKIFHIFSPIDTSIITTTEVNGPTTYIKGCLTQPQSPSNTLTLTIDPNEDLLLALVGSNLPPSTPYPGIGMYVFSNVECQSLSKWMTVVTAGPGFATLGAKSLIQISDILVGPDNKLTITLLSGISAAIDPCANLCTGLNDHDLYFQFSRQPWVANLMTSGGMVFGNDGFFADSLIQYNLYDPTGYQNVLFNLENQIVTALNRGVLVTPETKTTPAKLTTSDSKNWSIQTDWYTPGTTYNEYSYFVHTATIPNPNASGDPIPISYTPFNPRTSGSGILMSAAYGFGYDENSQVGDLTQVASKFDATVTPGSILTFTLGPWTGSNPACPP